MTIHFKTQLLAATAVIAATATGAQAQVAFPAAEIRGMGASSIAVILPQELNCISGNNALGKNDGNTSSVVEANYTGTDLNFNCGASTETPIQPNITGRYISTGSGTGKSSWKGITNALTGGSGLIFPNAFRTGGVSTGDAWTNVHFAMSDSPITGPLAGTELAAFNTASATKKAGAAIQFPLYVLPVAIAYSPIYGKKVAENIDLKFNVAKPVVAGSVASPVLLGGLRLTKAAYCGIFNGHITNWNDSKIEAANVTTDAKNKPITLSLRDPNDTAERWRDIGVPIRLVGRLDKSGTTDIFTRHLAATCGVAGILATGQANKYVRAAETLPYDSASGIDMTSVKSDSNIKPATTSTSTSIAGSADMISGAYYASGAIVTTGTGKGPEATGKFIVANGTSDVAAAIDMAPDKISGTDSNILLNGKIGYVAADFVAPSPGKTLVAAALEQGKTALGKTAPKDMLKAIYLMPSANNATTAFGTILPPQSDKNGVFSAKVTTNSRANPLDWVNVLYATGSTLANPTTGYPITGTTQFLTGTCFADAAVRNGVVTFLNLTLGNLKIDSTGKSIGDNTFTGTAIGKSGFKAQIGIAPMPASWVKAITETFLKYSNDKDGKTFLGDRALYIQNGLPTTTAQAANLSGAPTTSSQTTVKGKLVTTITYNAATRNPGCNNGEGL